MMAIVMELNEAILITSPNYNITKERHKTRFTSLKSISPELIANIQVNNLQRVNKSEFHIVGPFAVHCSTRHPETHSRYVIKLPLIETIPDIICLRFSFPAFNQYPALNIINFPTRMYYIYYLRLAGTELATLQDS